LLSTIVHTLSHALRERVGRAFARAARRPVPLRIGADIRSFYEPLTGIGWYLYHLLHEMSKSNDVEIYLFGDARVTDLGPSLHADVPPNARVSWFDMRGRGRISRIERAMTAAAYVLWMKIVDVDVMFAPNYFLPRLLGSVARRRVITVHDLTYKRFPELLQAETLRNLESHMAREIALADAIICVSESTRSDLLRFYELDPRRAVTIHSGLGTLAKPGPPPSLPDRYILFVSTIEPRKNLEVLLDAYESLRARGAYNGSLVIGGRIGWKSEGLIKRLRRPGIVHLDYVSASELAAVYEKAEIFVFPSIYEGFGFPLLEAMAHGVPAIAARSSSLPEIGGDAALYFDPSSAKELERQIELLLADPALRQELIARGRERSAEFNWSDAAARTLEVIRRVV
jgi:glycosyltransferase involved in cell wall biosynthesis